MSKKKLMVVFGTRPEIIKLAPVVKELEKYERSVQTFTVLTAQHREMADDLLEVFGITPDHDLDVMEAEQRLASLTSRLINGLDGIFSREKVDFVIVQGDTTTTFAASLVAYYHGVQVGHVEAGLRTGNKFNPFPEEMNRMLTARLADLHFAPTRLAKDKLIEEGVEEKAIHVTGNTVTDALLWVLGDGKIAISDADRERMILITAHRRESIGAPLINLCKAILQILDRHKDVRVVMPVHPNPPVRDTITEWIGAHDRVTLLPPLSYPEFVKELASAYFVLTDSGGVQEEAPSLGKPVLVTREWTERMEGIEAGNCILVGTSVERIVSAAEALLNDRQAYDRAARSSNLYGDGLASQRIVRHLLRELGLTPEE